MKKIILLVGIFVSAYFFVHGFSASIFAQTAIPSEVCSGVNADSTLPTGFSSPADFLYKADIGSACPPGKDCPMPKQSAHFRNSVETECTSNNFIVKVRPTAEMKFRHETEENVKVPFYVWQYGYQWDGTAWKQFEYTPLGGGSKSSGGWILGGAEKTGLSYTNTQSYVLAYTCTNTGTAASPTWKCGCRDSACATRGWQIQAPMKPTSNANVSKSGYTLTVSKSGDGVASGFVRSDEVIGQTNAIPASSIYGIMCGSDCAETYASGKKVVLRASVTGPTATGGNVMFTGWSGACSGTTPTCTVTMDAAKSITASFHQVVGGVPLTISKNGTGNGTVTSDKYGLSCGNERAECAVNTTSGCPVTLTATAATGSVFVGWSGGCTGTAKTCTVAMDTFTQVTATFNKAQN